MSLSWVQIPSTQGSWAAMSIKVVILEEMHCKLLFLPPQRLLSFQLKLQSSLDIHLWIPLAPLDHLDLLEPLDLLVPLENLGPLDLQDFKECHNPHHHLTHDLDILSTLQLVRISLIVQYTSLCRILGITLLILLSLILIVILIKPDMILSYCFACPSYNPTQVISRPCKCHLRHSYMPFQSLIRTWHFSVPISQLALKVILWHTE